MVRDLIHPEARGRVLREQFTHPYMCAQNFPRLCAPSAASQRTQAPVPDRLAQMSGSEAVATYVPKMPEACTSCYLLDDVCDRCRIKPPAVRDKTVTIDAAEDGAAGNLCSLEPCLESADRADGFVFGVWNADLAAGTLLVVLPPAQRADDALATEQA